jgi:hypothetical protein
MPELPAFDAADIELIPGIGAVELMPALTPAAAGAGAALPAAI